MSTAKQEEEETVKNQTLLFKEYAEKNGYTIVKEYVDDGWSGDILARPALDQLRQDTKQKQWQAVLFYDPDRIARRYSYQELVMDELKEAGAELLFITVSSPKNPEDKILYGVRGLFAEYERTKIAERFRMGKIRKVKEGHILTTEPLYGYSYIPKKEKVHGYYVINENEANVVRMIFSWIDNEGLTLRKIVRRLQELAIKPRKSTRGVWNTSTLSHLIKSKVYIGEAHWGKSYATIPEKPIITDKYRKTKKSSRKNRPESEWFIVPVPPIIDKVQFERVQSKTRQNFELCNRNRKNQYLLAGKIWCICGKRRAGEGPQKGKHLYYRCSSRVNAFPLKSECIEKGINARIVDSLIWDGVAAIMSEPEKMLEQTKRYINTDRKEINQVDTNAFVKEIEKLKMQADRYNKAYGAELLTIEQLKQYISPIKERISVLETQIQNNMQNQTENAIIIPSEEQINECAREATDHFNQLDFEGKREIILTVIDKVVGTVDKLQVNGFIPITKEKNVELFTNYRYGWNTTQHTEKVIPFQFQVKLPPPQKLFGNP